MSGDEADKSSKDDKEQNRSLLSRFGMFVKKDPKEAILWGLVFVMAGYTCKYPYMMVKDTWPLMKEHLSTFRETYSQTPPGTNYVIGVLGLAYFAVVGLLICDRYLEYKRDEYDYRRSRNLRNN